MEFKGECVCVLGLKLGKEGCKADVKGGVYVVIPKTAAHKDYVIGKSAEENNEEEILNCTISVKKAKRKEQKNRDRWDKSKLNSKFVDLSPKV